MQRFADRIKSFDGFPKTLDEFRVRTSIGATVSVFSLLLMSILILSEFRHYLATERTQHLVVDTSRNNKMQINFDVVFPRIGCAFINIDAVDVSKQHKVNVNQNLVKVRLDEKGNALESEHHAVIGGTLTSAAQLEAKKQPELPSHAEPSEPKCGSCYGAGEPGECCNTCEQVKAAYKRKGWSFNAAMGVEQCMNAGIGKDIEAQQKEGCRIHGFVEVHKVAGNVHLAPSSVLQHMPGFMQDVRAFTVSRFNTTHVINHLSVGPKFPGMVNPLDHVNRTMQTPGLFQYFLNVVPTEFRSLKGTVREAYQYSMTEHFRAIRDINPHGNLPGLFVHYEISPIRMQIAEQRRSLGHFLTSVCAIVGGVFTVSGLVDTLIHHLADRYRKRTKVAELTQ